MKRSGLRHPKTKALARELDIPLPHAIGILTLLFDFVGEYATAGNVGKFTDTEISDGCEWPADDAKRLIDALLEVRYFDAHKTHRFVVHDWFEHCEDFVKKRLARQNQGNGAPNPDNSGQLPKNSACQPYPTPANPAPAPTQPPKEAVSSVFPEGLQTLEFTSAWADWVDERKLSKRGPYTERGAAALFKRLAKMGADRAIAAIRNSIEQGYHGIHEPKGAPQNGRANDAAARRAAKREREFEYKGEQPADLKFDRK